MFSFLKKTGQIITKNLKRNKNVNRLEKDDILVVYGANKDIQALLKKKFN